MKTEFKNHIKYGKCWYDRFFKTNQRLTNLNKPSLKSSSELFASRGINNDNNHECKK